MMQIRRHLRPRLQRPSRLCQVAGRAGHYVYLAEPGQHGGDLEVIGCVAGTGSISASIGERSNQWLLSAPNPYHTWSHAIEFPIRYPSSGPLGRKRPAAEVAHPDWLCIRTKLVCCGASSGILKSKTSQLLQAHLISIKESAFDLPRINLPVCARSHA